MEKLHPRPTSKHLHPSKGGSGVSTQSFFVAFNFQADPGSGLCWGWLVAGRPGPAGLGLRGIYGDDRTAQNAEGYLLSY